MALRRQIIGRGTGPTEEDLEDADLEGTTTVVGEYDYDTPDVDEIQQAETGLPDRPIPVLVSNPVRVDELPSRSGGIFTRSVPTTGNRLLGEDPRRKSATLVPLDNDIRLGHTQAEAITAGAGCQWPANVPFVYTSADELWVAGILVATSVGVVVEQWAR